MLEMLVELLLYPAVSFPVVAFVWVGVRLARSVCMLLLLLSNCCCGVVPLVPANRWFVILLVVLDINIDWIGGTILDGDDDVVLTVVVQFASSQFKYCNG